MAPDNGDPGTPELKNEDLLAYYVLDEIYGQLRALAQEYPFLVSEQLFGQIIIAFEETKNERIPTLDSVRSTHEGLIQYLEGIDPAKGGADVVSIGRGQAGGKKFIVSEGLKDFDAIVERVREERRQEQLLEAHDSAVDSVILGETALLEIVLTHREEIRNEILERLADTLVHELDDAEIDPIDVINEYGVNRTLKLLTLEDGQLLELSGNPVEEIAQIIIAAREFIRNGDSEGAQDQATRLQETAFITYGKELDEDDELDRRIKALIPRISLEEMDRFLSRLPAKLEQIKRMQHGIGATPEHKLESKAVGGNEELKARLALIEHEALQKLEGRRGPKKSAKVLPFRRPEDADEDKDKEPT